MNGIEPATTKSLRVLFVCFADSSHSHSWMDLLANSNIQARAFAVMVLGDGLLGGMYDPQPWNQPMYVCVPPKVHRPGGMVRSLFPDLPGMRRLGEWADALESQGKIPQADHPAVETTHRSQSGRQAVGNFDVGSAP